MAHHDRPYRGPAAFNANRMHWENLPIGLRRHIGNLAGGEITVVDDVVTGFSPGFAGVVHVAGRENVFVKAISGSRHPHSVQLARDEIAANQLLPSDVIAPPMLWHEDDGDWVIAGFEAIEGHTPIMPWEPDELALAFGAIDRLAHHPLSADHGLQPFAQRHADDFRQWARFSQLPDAERLELASHGGPWGEWALRHLDTLCAWEADAAEASQGTALVHADLRGDNMMIANDGQVYLVDWGYASVGAPWLDLVDFLPSAQMQGAGLAADLFAQHPLSKGVEHEALRATLTGLTGFFMINSWEPAPAPIPTLRDFQAGQAVPAAQWLQALEPSLA